MPVARSSMLRGDGRELYSKRQFTKPPPDWSLFRQAFNPASIHVGCGCRQGPQPGSLERLTRTLAVEPGEFGVEQFVIYPEISPLESIKRLPKVK